MKMDVRSIWRWILMAATVSVAQGGFRFEEDEAEMTAYRFDLSTLQLSGAAVGGGPVEGGAQKKVMVSTATNSPIYYIDRAHFPSFLLKPRPQQKKKKRRPPTRAPTTTTSAPSTPRPSTIQMLPLPFVSNAKPYGYYHWSPTATTTTTIATPPISSSTAAPPTITNSKVIRLKTRFLANGRPSALYLHNSPHRRYSLKDLLLPRPAHSASSFAHAHNKHSYKRKTSRKPLYNDRKPSYNNRKWWN